MRNSLTVSKDNSLQDIWDKLWLWGEVAHLGRGPISVFRGIFTCAGENFILGWGLSAGP